MAKKKKNEETVLFPEAKVGDIVIKPWSFGILFQISDLLEQVITSVEEKGIEVDEFISYVTMIKIFTIASKQVLKIMSITLDMEEKDIEALSMEDGVRIALIIAKQNWTIISKNVLSLLPAILEEEKEETEEKEQEEEKKEN